MNLIEHYKLHIYKESWVELRACGHKARYLIFCHMWLNMYTIHGDVQWLHTGRDVQSSSSRPCQSQLNVTSKSWRVPDDRSEMIHVNQLSRILTETASLNAPATIGSPRWRRAHRVYRVYRNVIRAEHWQKPDGHQVWKKRSLMLKGKEREEKTGRICLTPAA